MDITLSTNGGGYREGYEEFKKDATGKGLTWLEAIREQGIARFSELGFPTPANEDWRFTNVAPIARTPFSITRNGLEKLSPGRSSPTNSPGSKR